MSWVTNYVPSIVFHRNRPLPRCVEPSHCWHPERAATALAMIFAVLLGLALAQLPTTAQGQTETIIATDFPSTNITTGTNLLGTQLGLSSGAAVNLPGGSWSVNCGGDDTTQPPSLYPASWGYPTVVADTLSYANACLAVPLTGNGYAPQQGQLTISTNVQFGPYNPGWDGGLGFWSTLPAAGSGVWGSGNPPAGTFSGLEVVNDNAIQAYINGAAVGSPVSLGYTIGDSNHSRSNFYNLAYTIDTSSGSISNVSFNGASLTGFSATGFSVSGTAYAGVTAAQWDAVAFEDLSVVGQAPPPPPPPSNWTGATSGDISDGTNYNPSPVTASDLQFFVSTSASMHLPSSNSTAGTAAGLIFGNGYDPGGTVSITSSNGITIGGDGIADTALRAITLALPITLAKPQSWSNNSASTMTVSGNVDNGGFNLAIVGSGNVALNGAVNGAGGLTYGGGGTLTLNAANGYGGATNVASGTVVLGVANALPTGTTLTVNGGGLDLSGHDQQVATLSGSGGVVTSSAGAPLLTVNTAGASNFGGAVTGSLAVTMAGNGVQTLSGVNSYSGVTNVNTGTLEFGQVASQPTGGSVNVAAGATLAVLASGYGNSDIDNIWNGTGNITFAKGAFLAIDSTGGSYTYSSIIGDANGGTTPLKLSAIGTGTLVLSGNNAFTGGMYVNGGTVVLSGSNSFTGGLFLNGGTTVATTDSNFGVTGGSITFNGGTLEMPTTAIGLAASRPIVVNAGGGSVAVNIAHNGDPSTFSIPDNITGSGQLSLPYVNYNQIHYVLSGDNSGFTGILSPNNRSMLELDGPKSGGAGQIVFLNWDGYGNGTPPFLPALLLRNNTATTFLTSNVDFATNGAIGTSPAVIDVGPLTSGAAGTTLTLNQVTVDYNIGSKTLNITGASGYNLGITTLSVAAYSEETLQPTTASVVIGAVTGTFGGYESTTPHLTLGGTATGNTIGSIQIQGSSLYGQPVVQVNSGVWTFTGSSTYTAPMIIAGGEVNLNFGAASSPTSNIIPSGGTVTLGGGRLVLTGSPGASNSQTDAVTNVGTYTNTYGVVVQANGSSSVVLNSNGASALSLNLGAD